MTGTVILLIYYGNPLARSLWNTGKDKDVAIEKNMFPYDTHNPCIEHWTLWSREELSHRRICMFVEEWCAVDPVGKEVVEWNYEENSHRSFDVPHVHVFLRFAEIRKKEEVPTLGPSSHSQKRSFSSVETTASSSSSSTESSPSDYDSSDSEENTASAQRKKVCSTRINVLSPPSSSFGSVSDYEEGETDGEDSDIEASRKKKNCYHINPLRSLASAPRRLTSPDEGFTDCEDEA